MEQTYCFPGHIHPYPGFGSEILDNSPLDVFPSSSSSFESPSDDLEPYIHPVQSFISIALPETVPDSCFPHIHSGVPPSVSSTPVAHVESQSTASSLYCCSNSRVMRRDENTFSDEDLPMDPRSRRSGRLVMRFA